jgi:hypothetical protein
MQIIYPLDDGRNFKGCCALELEFGRSTAERAAQSEYLELK